MVQIFAWLISCAYGKFKNVLVEPFILDGREFVFDRHHLWWERLNFGIIENSSFGYKWHNFEDDLIYLKKNAIIFFWLLTWKGGLGSFTAFIDVVDEYFWQNCWWQFLTDRLLVSALWYLFVPLYVSCANKFFTMLPILSAKWRIFNSFITMSPTL